MTAINLTKTQGPLACPPVTHDQRSELGQMVISHHVEGLVTGYLEQYPGFLCSVLQKHEIWLARYMRDEYNIQLPTRKAIRPPDSTRMATSNPMFASHPAKSQANPQANPQVSPQVNPQVNLTHSATSRVPTSNPTFANNPAKSQANPQVNPQVNLTHSATSRVPGTNPITAANPRTAPSPAEDDNGYHSEKSTSSLPSAWPSKEDLEIPYPTPDKHLLPERSLPRGTGNKWTFDEQDIAIGFMYGLRDDPQGPRTEKRFEEVSRLMMEVHNIERSKNSVKNMWNRIGRHRSQYDERKNKNAPLATSQQGKQARVENELKKAGKRRATEEPPSAQPSPKMTKRQTSSQPYTNYMTRVNPAVADPKYEHPSNYKGDAFVTPGTASMNSLQPQRAGMPQTASLSATPGLLSMNAIQSQQIGTLQTTSSSAAPGLISMNDILPQHNPWDLPAAGTVSQIADSSALPDLDLSEFTADFDANEDVFGDPLEGTFDGNFDDGFLANFGGNFDGPSDINVGNDLKSNEGEVDEDNLSFGNWCLCEIAQMDAEAGQV